MAGRAPQPPAVPQPPGGGHHHHHPYPYPYPYPYPHPVAAEGEGPEEEAEAFELRPRGREKVRRSASRDRPDDIVLLARDIQEGDTLNAIALQFCCSVADIKRVNNLINDQDFFALRSIKIPVKKFSVLTETHASPKGRPVLRPAHCSPEVQEASPSDKFSANETAGNFLKEVDRDIEEIVKCNDTKRENLNEVVSALAAQQVCFETDGKTKKSKDPYYGADWGIGWWTAVVIMLIIGIITPVFYLLYYEVLVKADVSHHSTMESAHSFVTAASHQKQIENGMNPANIINVDNQGDLQPYNRKPQATVIHRHIT
ncbi:lysM and putative peptidoglycan-binding domain-containing protein 3 [Anas platyrhynchos]|uniref:LysM and putative peptidoglycan-binding domain-containing protein 3 n=2 Tax=Anas TaxID=8835 RepID=A0A8B9UT22_9AVES|nr:lysM and putative peptidoglycan-binding domain-containing protein 3 [Anas platyrhynchos]|eukprot:XP_027301902.1 lysM and putative peptidoglycan-binding domain-containing protein 3 [Anas platyrhynchos]